MTRPVTRCADCRTPVTSSSRGLCHRCYQRHYKRGDLHKFSKSAPAATPTCTRCERQADAGRGLCKRCYVAHRDRQIGYGRWAVDRIDPTPTVDHIQSLVDKGMSLASISIAAGLAPATVGKIVRGDVSWVAGETAERIAAVTAPAQDWRTLPDRALVCPVGTARRLQALSALGWPQTVLAEELGVAQQAAARLIGAARPTVQAGTARAVAALFDRLSMTPGPSHSALLRAERKGWARPLEWDENTIDDPDSSPDFGTAAFNPRRTAWWRGQPCRIDGCPELCGGGGFDRLCRRHHSQGLARSTGDVVEPRVNAATARAAERRETVTALSKQGLSAAEIAERIGVDARTVVRDRNADRGRVA
ncbi:hypothetical protein WKY82_10430 [Gordonia malaquae]|uniref:helix-turn-helix domain-containing protein n=1 Tax=Gordonia malaquae TaxID=410332 RepID=UPI0030C798F4